MILSSVAILLAVIALILAVMALVKASDNAGSLKVYRNSAADTAEELKQKLTALEKSLSTKTPPEKAPTAFPPSVQRPYSEGPPPKKPPPPERKPAPPPPPPPPAPAPAPEPAGTVEEEQLINFNCPHCGQNIDAPSVMAGMQVSCPTCAEPLNVPAVGSGNVAPPKVDAEGETSTEDLTEEAMKGATVRIDVGQMFEELDRPKRQIVIKRRQ